MPLRKTPIKAGQPLTYRERQVLIRLADGSTRSEIADELELDLGTVHAYVRRLKCKLGASTQTHAVALAYHRHIIEAKQ